MRDRILSTTLAAAVTGAALVGGPAAAQSMGYSVSGNVGVFSNYVWRGFTQNADEAAVLTGRDITDEYKREFSLGPAVTVPLRLSYAFGDITGLQAGAGLAVIL